MKAMNVELNTVNKSDWHPSLPVRYQIWILRIGRNEKERLLSKPKKIVTKNNTRSRCRTMYVQYIEAMFAKGKNYDKL